MAATVEEVLERVYRKITSLEPTGMNEDVAEELTRCLQIIGMTECHIQSVLSASNIEVPKKPSWHGEGRMLAKRVPAAPVISAVPAVPAVPAIVRKYKCSRK